jgi:hypothetical protein
LASNKRSSPSPSPSIQQTWKLEDARQKLLCTLKAAVLALNSEIFRLETTGDLVDSAIEKAFERSAWAVDSFREEQEMDRLETELIISDVLAAKSASRHGFDRGVTL